MISFGIYFSYLSKIYAHRYTHRCLIRKSTLIFFKHVTEIMVLVYSIDATSRLVEGGMWW